MVPYSNRIENGFFTFAGRQYQLQNGENHAIHGDVRARSWKVLSQGAGRLHCGFSSSEHEAINWPWPFEAEVEYRLEGGSFVSHLRLWNRGDGPMPAGFGWHPYFNRTLTQKGERVLLLFLRWMPPFPTPMAPAFLPDRRRPWQRGRILGGKNY